MTTPYFQIGAGPEKEELADITQRHYKQKAEQECKAWIQQLRRVCGPEPLGAALAIKAFPHEAGSYYEVVVYYKNDAALQYAYRIEEMIPLTWDQEAREELER